jgi:hypothetical protein
MKNFILMLTTLLFITSICSIEAQTPQKMNDKDRISIGVWIPNQVEGLTASTHNMLENKLNQIITTNGLNDSPNSRFIMSANVVVLTKDVTPTAPPMQAFTLEITFYIGDGFEGKAFSNYSTTIIGVGENETKAYISALRNIKTNDPAYQTFIDKAKSRILAYYETNCDFIIKGAISLAKTRQYGAAIWELTSIPTVCTGCWENAMNAVAPIFRDKINFECGSKLNEATNVWNAGQSWDAANRAANILSGIDPQATCYPEVKSLANKISKRIYEIDKREWNFKLESEIGLKRDMIKAYRDVGVAYGNGQAQNIQYKSLW